MDVVQGGHREGTMTNDGRRIGRGEQRGDRGEATRFRQGFIVGVGGSLREEIVTLIDQNLDQGKKIVTEEENGESRLVSSPSFFAVVTCVL